MPSEPANSTLPAEVPSDSSVHLVQVLARYQLLEPAQQQEAAESLQGRFPEPRRLAHELIQRNWLTPYQVNQLFQGKGQQLALGSYVILERIGEGGMGQVFKARHQNLGRLAALKIIRKDRLTNPMAVLRFRREIQAVAQLSHPNVVVAFDADQVGDTHYFSMEYVEGIDLGRLLKTQGPLPVAAAHDYLRQAARGLQHAHERGLIHRDIKPSNLLLARPTGPSAPAVIKILDLGLARLERPADGSDMSSSLTNDGQLMGTPDFIAPEQARNSHRIDARADLYSLGCTFYYLLTGQVPFQADTVTEKLYKHWFEAVRPIEQLRPDTTPLLARVIWRLLAKQPEERYQSATALLAALDGAEPMAAAVPARDAAGSNDAPLAVPVAATAATVEITTATLPQAVPVAAVSVAQARPVAAAPGTVARPAKPIWLFAAAGGVGLLLVVGVLLLSLRSGKTPTASRQTVDSRPRTREQQADADFQPLLARYGDRKADPENLRRDLLAYRLSYGDLPSGTRAAEMVTRLPSPLDQLSGKIPQEERFEDRPKQLVAVLGERRWRHWGQVQAVAMSPDAQTVASGGQDGIRVWDIANGHEQAVLHAGGVRSLVYSADGKTLTALTWDGKVLVWDLNDESRPDPVQGPVKDASVFALSADGTLAAAASEDGPIKVWQTATGKELSTLKNSSRAQCLAFAPDGATLAAAGDDRAVRLWNVRSGTQRGRLEGHGASIRALTFSADGQTLASGGDDAEIRLWDVTSKKARTTLMGHHAPVTALLFMPDDKTLASGDGAGEVRLWRLGSAREAVLRGHTGPIAGLAARGKKTAISASLDGSLRVWNLADEQEDAPLAGHAGVGMAVAISPDCKLLATGSYDCTVKLWDLPALKDRATLRSHTGGVRCVAFSGDGQRLASGGWDGLVKLWDPITGAEKTTLAPHRGQIAALAYALDGRTVAAGSWATEPGPKGKNLDFGEVKLWELPGNRERACMRTIHRHGVSAVALAANGKLGASGSQDGTVRLWEVPSGRDRGTLEAGGPVESVAFNPAGSTLAAGCRRGQVRLWDVATQKPRGSFTCQGTVTGVAFSPDSLFLAAADSEGNILVWELTSSRQYEAWKVPGTVFGLAFASDGRHIATANANSTFYIFRLKGYQPRW